jgi:AcrR family transcriptional regulator
MSSTRDRILVATNELFRRSGYNGTSLAQISAASGATIGSIYHFFPGGKEALAIAVIETTGAVYRELFDAVASTADDAAGAFVDFFAGAALVLAESDYIDPCPIGGIAREIANTSEPLRLAAAAVFESWIAGAHDHLVHAGLDEDEAQDLALMFVATVEGSFVVSRTRRSTDGLVAAGQGFAELVRARSTSRARRSRRIDARQ